MERLTTRDSQGRAYFDNDATLIRGANGAFHQKKDMTVHYIHDRFVALDKVIDRLAAYEDTGLTPEEIMALIPLPNDPLTLEELRGMDGEPVWIVPMCGSGGFCTWMLVDAEYELCREAHGEMAVFENCGKTWLAYRRKPEEG
jgi:hypothetical protein